MTGNTILEVQSTPLTVTTAALPGATINVSYSTTLTASGGILPYTWAITSGSLPTGLTLNSSTGVISGTPTAAGTYSFTAQVSDTAGSAPASKALSITVAAQQTSSTIWSGTTVPGTVDAGPDSAVELGVKFRSDANGFISGLRFYKASTNTGTHIGNLWTSTGTLLATATFTNETASGWQQVNFSTPVAITANTVYVASYHTNVGHYSNNLNYFTSKGVDNPPLHALANGVSGPNGVFAYGSTSKFPDQGWKESNYWVDVVYSATTAPPATLSTITVTPASPTISTGSTQQFTATGTYSDGSTQNITSQATWTSSTTSIATINSSGLATGVSSGSTTISAALSGKNGNTALTVTAIAPPATLSTITVTPGTPTISTGSTQQFTATGTYSDGSTRNITSQTTWATSSMSVATINSSGLASGVGPGVTTVTAALSGITGNTTLAVQSTPLTVTTAALPGATINVSYSTTLTASGGILPYTWAITSGSLPTGLTLNSSTGVISGTPTAAGTYSFTAQVSDTAGSAPASKALSITVAAQQTSSTIWSGTTVPGTVDAGPDSAVELGVKFRSDANGFISGLRFYKASTNTGTHIGNLWTSTGTLLATATFTNETASGWQQVNFSTPVAITANTVYVASYHTNVGHYSNNLNYFTSKGVDNPPLHALANGVSGPNGVFAYGSTSKFPDQGWKESNYWVDVVYSATTAPPATLSTITVTPASPTISTGSTQQFTATGTYSDGSTQNITSQATWTSSTTSIATINSSGLATGVSSGSTTISAALSGKNGNTALTVQSTPLTVTTAALPGATINVSYSTTLTASGGILPYTWAITSGSLPTGLTLNSSTGVISGTPTVAGTYSFTTQVSDSAGSTPATKGLSIAIVRLDKPILVISASSNPFSKYYAEILRAEGFTEFAEIDITTASSAVLADYDVVILGEMMLTASQSTMLSNWVFAGGNLVAMRPDKKLAGILGLTDMGSTLSNAYLLVDTSSNAGLGIVGQTIQYHGDADLYTMTGASRIATLFSGSSTTTSNPAVTINNVGANGGQAAAFTYDLARSVVYTRQGNPAWAGQNRSGESAVRPSDLFFGAASFDPQPDWIDLNKVAIPQADEQQRLLANIIIQMNLDKKPLPRFWYLPRNLAAAVVMTGDDHGALYGGGATSARFDQYLAASPEGCIIDNWECVRGTSYLVSPMIASNPLTNDQAAAFNANGFEVSVHVDSNCSDWTFDTLESAYTSQLNSFVSQFTSIPDPATHRMHCIIWSDYDSQPKIELSHGIRLDTTYYYWPDRWVNDRPGFFTGSGMPMRFADINGNILDVYQAATQMTDESGQSYPYTIDTLLDRATGPEGYFGVFTVNAHPDVAASTVSDAVVNSALARGIPVVSAKQMLTWLDGRNNSSFNSISWNGTILSFSVSAAQGANGLVAMVPLTSNQTVSGITQNGSSIAFTTTTVKGIQYARFFAASGNYQVTYASRP